MVEGKVASLGNYSSKSEEQIEKMSEVHSFSDAELDHLKILRQGMKDQKILKMFRELRTRLYTHASSKNFVCMVTSVAEDGGASYVSRNLSAAIALDKTKTAVIVDCNFYDPSAEELLGADSNLGLTDYLSVRDMGVEFVVYASGIPRVRVIPSGGNAEAATERLSSSKMQMFVQELKTRYSDRYIIFDGPSVGEYSADVRLIGSLVDFVVLVVPYGKVSDAQVRSAIETIGKDRLAGVVFNYV
ncbi:MAG: protein-tyrosine kinase [Flavobacteriales bacterium]|jgi:protein-tyrosine kinase